MCPACFQTDAELTELSLDKLETCGVHLNRFNIDTIQSQDEDQIQVFVSQIREHVQGESTGAPCPSVRVFTCSEHSLIILLRFSSWNSDTHLDITLVPFKNSMYCCLLNIYINAVLCILIVCVQYSHVSRLPSCEDLSCEPFCLVSVSHVC